MYFSLCIFDWNIKKNDDIVFITKYLDLQINKIKFQFCVYNMIKFGVMHSYGTEEISID